MTPKYTLEDKKLVISYDFTRNHMETLLLIKGNDGIAEFENRDEFSSDVDQLDLSWSVCDELVEMGLLEEDLESHSIYYEITEAGEKIFNKLL